MGWSEVGLKQHAMVSEQERDIAAAISELFSANDHPTDRHTWSSYPGFRSEIEAYQDKQRFSYS
jgi:hypothetical protein